MSLSVCFASLCPSPFQIGQCIYIFWNAINDPLFAWFQDRTRGSKVSALAWGGPLLGLSFLLPFMPLGTWCGGSDAAVGMHFIASLCAFDGVFTYACLAHCALFAEITSVQSERLGVLRVGELSMLLLAPVVLLSNHLFVRDALAQFRVFAVLVAILCAAALLVASRYVRTAAEVCGDPHGTCGAGKLTQMVASSPSGSGARVRGPSLSASSGSLSTIASVAAGSAPSLRTFLSQFFAHRSMLLFMALNFLQVYTLAYFNSFFTIILSSLDLAQEAPWAHDAKGSILAASQLLPPLIILALSQAEELPGKDGVAGIGAAAAASTPPPADRAYRVVRGLTLLKIALSACMWALGSGRVLAFACYLFLTRALATATFAFFNIILSELIDEDTVVHGRAAPFSSSYFGINALFTKPAQSIAPIMTVGLWSRFGFREDAAGGAATAGATVSDAASAAALSDPIRSSPQAAQLQQVVFLCCTLGPLLTGVAQALIWRFYLLHGARLQRVKQQLLSMGVNGAAACTPALVLDRLERGSSKGGVASSDDSLDREDAESPEQVQQRLLSHDDKRR